MTNKNFFVRPRCPVCASDRAQSLTTMPYAEGLLREFFRRCYQQITDSDLRDAHYTLLRCEGCDLIYQKEIPDDGFMSRLYALHNPDEMLSTAQAKKDVDYYMAIAREIAFIVHWLKKKPHELDVLDFGMGWGEWCLMAKAFGCNAVGSEMSQEKIMAAVKKGVRNISFEEIATTSWDFINTEQVVEHLPDPVSLLTYLGKSLKPNGLIKVSVPGRFYGFPLARSIRGNGAFARFRKWDDFRNNSVQPLEHINCFSLKSLVALGRAANLKLVRQPITSQYICAISGSTGKKLLKNVVKPIYRAFRNNNYVFFGRSAGE